MSDGWERITAYSKTVWWRYSLPNQHWLSVRRQEDGTWRWGFHSRDLGRKATGYEKSWQSARRSAMSAAGMYCPHGCGRLRWLDDQWYCPTCESEFIWEDVGLGAAEVQ